MSDPLAVLDEMDRYVERVTDTLNYVDAQTWDAVVAAIRGVLTLHVPVHGYCVRCDADRDVETLGNNPDCAHHRSYCRQCDSRWPCRTVAEVGDALAAYKFEPCGRGPIGIVTNCVAMNCETNGCAMDAPQQEVSLDDLGPYGAS